MDNASEKTPLVGIIMGSKSDMPVMEGCTAELDALGVPYELVIASAHRNPDKVHEWAETAADRGIKVIIAAAGKAAHLGGVVAAFTPLPVIGVPMKTSDLGGLDSRCSPWCRCPPGCRSPASPSTAPERGHLRHADHRCHHARVPRRHRSAQARYGRGVVDHGHLRKALQTRSGARSGTASRPQRPVVCVDRRRGRVAARLRGPVHPRPQVGYKQASEFYDGLSEQAVKDSDGSGIPNIDFDALKQVNDDVVGWIYIPGTNINYVVVSGKDQRHLPAHAHYG